MVVGDGAQGAPDLGLLEEEGEGRDEGAGEDGGVEVELVDEDAVNGEGARGDADVEGMHVAAPQDLAQPDEEIADPQGRHEEDDLGLVDEGA